MMKRKTKGQNFKSLFDELDWKIIQILFIEPQGILSLTKVLRVEYKTTKKHIDRLVEYGLIYIKPQAQNKKLLLLPPPVVMFLTQQKNFLSNKNIDDSFKEVTKQLFKISNVAKQNEKTENRIV